VVLFWCATEKKTLDDYDAEQRRTLTMQGGTNAVPLPAWMTSIDNRGSRGEGLGEQQLKTSTIALHARFAFSAINP
jgi:hypothetical protein